MTAARTFVRLALGGLFVGSLAMACVVESSGDDDDLANTPCDDGDVRQCDCPGDEIGQRECNASNTGFGPCQCDGSPVAGSSSGGTSNSEAGAPSSTGGTGTNYGGEPNTTGGVPAEIGGAPAETGGAGGAGEVDPGLCAEDPNDTCANCYQQACCDQWTACAGDDACLTEFLNIVACIEIIKEDRNVLPADLEACADEESSAAGPWSQGVSPLTADVVNCIGGEDEGGWESMPWGELSCKASCFDN